MKKKFMIFIVSALFAQNALHAAQYLQRGRAALSSATKRARAALPQSPTVQAVVKFVQRKPLTADEKKLLKGASLKAALVAAVAAITGLTAAAVRNRLQEESSEPKSPGSIEFMAEQPIHLDVDQVAQGYGVTLPSDDSPASLLVRGAAVNGNVSVVNALFDLVDKPILQIAYDIAKSKLLANWYQKKAGEFRSILLKLEFAINTFNPVQVDINQTFLVDAIGGNLEGVKRVICYEQKKPSDNAIKEAKTATKDPDIKTFLNNLVCE